MVATVGTPGVDASPDGYTATIDWGDGSPVEAGTIVAQRFDHEVWFPYDTPPRTMLLVKGDHTYHGVGVHTLSVTVTDASGESHTFTNVVFVNPRSRHPRGDRWLAGRDADSSRQTPAPPARRAARERPPGTTRSRPRPQPPPAQRAAWEPPSGTFRHPCSRSSPRTTGASITGRSPSRPRSRCSGIPRNS